MEQQIGGYPKEGQLSSGLDEAVLDSEGRCVILEFPAFVLIGVYSPATRDDTRTEFREGFQDAMDVRIRNLVAMGKQVVLCGDLNIVRSGLDTAGLLERLRKESMTLEDFLSTPSRRFLNQLVFGGEGEVLGGRDEGREEPIMWDLCREFHPDRTGMFTCWETKKNARPGNFGSRIDYVLCTSGIKDWFIDSNIQEGLLGSDHCPVYATLAETVSKDGASVHITDLMNPEGMFKDGERQREWTSKDLLPLSAKLIPEFTNRRSIRDMFSKSASTLTNNDIQSSATSADVSSATSPARDLTQDSVIWTSQSSDHAPTTGAYATMAQRPSPIVTKRQAEPSTSLSRPQKKNKASSSKESTTKSGAGAGQRSLMGFFKPKTPQPDASPKKEMARQDKIGTPPGTNTPTPATSGIKGKQILTQEDTFEDCPPSSSQPPSQNDKQVFDPIQNKESWSKLLGKRILPKCEHGDDCQIMVTKKPGINRGKLGFPHISYPTRGGKVYPPATPTPPMTIPQLPIFPWRLWRLVFFSTPILHPLPALP